MTSLTQPRFVTLILAVLVAMALPAPAQTLNVVYSFSDGADGAQPYSQLVRDPAGNGYGTAALGGDLSGCGGMGCGVIFKVSTSGQ